jgi:hypothetical protein
MPMIDFNSKIMQSRTNSEDSFNKIVSPESALILNDPHHFGAAYGMFYPYSERSHFPVVFLFPVSEFPSLWLFYGLFTPNAIRFIILYPYTVCRAKGKYTSYQLFFCHGFFHRHSH